MQDRSKTAPEQVGPQDAKTARTVHLPALVSDEFGVSRSLGRMEISMGQVFIDDEPYEGDKFDVPYDFLVGKWITIKGTNREWRLFYEPK